MTDGSELGPSRVCPWCTAPVPPNATRCPACGDALAQRESIDDLAIPGVTTVDPALEAYAARPLHIPLPV
ncbi:MAG: zinc-ribbon domain-containing protein, partial [Thermoplasmata archaeon]|nr:zinc-ribbon domain-containing protein [Thermoplasmata archaeon]